MVRLALIGCADELASLAQLTQRVRGAEVTAVVDRLAPMARCAASAIKAKIAVHNFDQLLYEHRAEFDAVIIQSSSDRAVVAICQAATSAGKHILVRNSFNFSATALVEIITTCSVAGARLILGQASRFQPSVQAVKKSLDLGQLGEPGLVRIHNWESSTFHDGDRISMDSDQPATAPVFKRLAVQLDLVCWLFGDAPTSVFAQSRDRSDGRGNECDYVQAHLGFTQGGMALIDCAQTLLPGGGYFSLSLIGSKGAAYADDHHNMQLLFAGGNPNALCAGQTDLTTVAQLQEFVTSLNENRESMIPGADILRAIRIAETVAESLSTQQAFRRTNQNYNAVFTT